MSSEPDSESEVIVSLLNERNRSDSPPHKSNENADKICSSDSDVFTVTNTLDSHQLQSCSFSEKQKTKFPSENQCTSSNATLEYRIVKSEPVSDDEFLPVTFEAVNNPISELIENCRHIKEKEQEQWHTSIVNESNTNDSSDSHNVDHCNSSVEVMKILDSCGIKQDDDLEVIEEQGKLSPVSVLASEEREVSGDNEKMPISECASAKLMDKVKTSALGREQEQETNCEKTSLHPTGLYQNVHVIKKDRKTTRQKLPQQQTTFSVTKNRKNTDIAKKQKRTKSLKKPQNLQHIQRSSGCVSDGSSSDEEVFGESEDVFKKLDELEEVSHFKESTEFKTRTKRRAREIKSLPVGKRKKKQSKGANLHQCPVCSSTFTCAASQRIHMRLHTGEKPYMCEECSAAFSDNSALRRHKRIHSGSKPYTCKECGKAFARSFTLTVHLRWHSGEKPYQCQHCGMSFSQSANLKKHIRVHTGDKPYQCDLCPAAFAQGHALKSHYTIHKDEKPYMCQECGDIFSRPQYLQKHMKTHDHTKSYLCQYCPATFRTHESLRYHTESHLGDKTYQCEECLMTFHRKDHYKVHKFRTHRNVKYSCNMCEAIYNRSDHLKRHKTKAHPCGF